jgi:hypothetical protein
MAYSTSSGKNNRSKGVQVYMDVKIGPRFAGRMVFEVSLKPLSPPSLAPSSSLPSFLDHLAAFVHAVV